MVDIRHALVVVTHEPSLRAPFYVRRRNRTRHRNRCGMPFEGRDLFIVSHFSRKFNIAIDDNVLAEASK